jgi:hypothetical protein
MKILFKTLYCLVLLSLATVFMAEGANAGINLPYSSTFDCSSWSENYPNNTNPSCGGLQAVLYANTSWHSQITPDANNPAGGGGNGWRMWLGDGTNTNSSVYGYYFNTPQKEIWSRFYVRYEPGFSWSGNAPYYHKIVYLYTSVGANGGFEWGHEGGSGRVNSWSNNDSKVPTSSSNIWNAMFPTGKSDGSWHCWEFHAKMDTNSANGVAELWIDGVKQVSSYNVNWSGGNATVRSQGWTIMGLSVNQLSPANAGGIGNPAYVDYDDIVINNTGYIGPLGGSSGGSSNPAPSSPTGVRTLILP